MMRMAFYGIILLLLLIGNERVALACPDGAYESHITRVHPVNSVPDGSIQLMVDVDHDEDRMRSKKSGTITLPVSKVINGIFPSEKITFSFNNSSSCDYFGSTGKNRYIVVYPLRYAEGDPVLDKDGQPEFHVIRYSYNADPSYLGILQDDERYFLDKSTPEIYSCIRRGGAESQAIDACFNADEPHKLYRQSYSRYYAPLLLGCACLIAGFFILRRLRTR